MHLFMIFFNEIVVKITKVNQFAIFVSLIKLLTDISYLLQMDPVSSLLLNDLRVGWSLPKVRPIFTIEGQGQISC